MRSKPNLTGKNKSFIFYNTQIRGGTQTQTVKLNFTYTTVIFAETFLFDKSIIRNLTNNTEANFFKYNHLFDLKL